MGVLKRLITFETSIYRHFCTADFVATAFTRFTLYKAYSVFTWKHLKFAKITVKMQVLELVLTVLGGFGTLLFHTDELLLGLE